MAGKITKAQIQADKERLELENKGLQERVRSGNMTAQNALTQRELNYHEQLRIVKEETKETTAKMVGGIATGVFAVAGTALFLLGGYLERTKEQPVSTNTINNTTTERVYQISAEDQKRMSDLTFQNADLTAKLANAPKTTGTGPNPEEYTKLKKEVESIGTEYQTLKNNYQTIETVAKSQREAFANEKSGLEKQVLDLNNVLKGKDEALTQLTEANAQLTDGNKKIEEEYARAVANLELTYKVKGNDIAPEFEKIFQVALKYVQDMESIQTGYEADTSANHQRIGLLVEQAMGSLNSQREYLVNRIKLEDDYLKIRKANNDAYKQGIKAINEKYKIKAPESKEPVQNSPEAPANTQ